MTCAHCRAALPALHVTLLIPIRGALVVLVFCDAACMMAWIGEHEGVEI